MSRLHRELSLILWAGWNPIAHGVPTDEFDNYAPRLMGMLERGESEEAIAEELGRIRTEAMGIETDRNADLIAADLLRIWFDERDRDSLGGRALVPGTKTRLEATGRRLLRGIAATRRFAAPVRAGHVVVPGTKT